MSQKALANIVLSIDSIKSTLGMAPSLPKTYKAAIFKGKGQPLTLEQVELKEPQAGEILIKVQACGGEFEFRNGCRLIG